ncbi:hypothetical protein JXO59_05215 [candidate division KSB1 bacterium]|nr:hypothetical protein [candidate division KSB1 bacterium]
MLWKSGLRITLMCLVIVLIALLFSAFDAFAQTHAGGTNMQGMVNSQGQAILQ